MRHAVSFDWMILVLSVILCGFGAIVVGSVYHELLGSQIFFYVVGVLTFFLFSRVDFTILARLWKIIYFGSLTLLLFTLLFGFESRGAMRWVSLGGFRLQLSELLKPLFLTAIAGFLVSRKNLHVREFLQTMLYVSLPVFLIFRQPDFGSAFVYFFFFLVVFFAANFPISYFFIFGGSIVGFAPLIWQFLAQYQRNRILSFFLPHLDPLGAGYNAIQSLITIGSGGFWGKGLGRGTQSQLYFLPERHTDFIFASLSEEVGFFGAAAVLMVYFILLWRVLKIAFETKTVLGRLICVGVAGVIGVQVFVNVGMNLGILPLTGITLPLVSYGGSSILATFALLGLAENVVMERHNLA